MIERQSQWHHVVFSLVLCLLLAGIYLIKPDLSGLWIVLLVGIYILGNTLLHVKRRDFKTETFYEYLLLGLAVVVVFLGALRH